MNQEIEFTDLYDKLLSSSVVLTEEEKLMVESVEFNEFKEQMQSVLGLNRKEHLVRKKEYLKSLDKVQPSIITSKYFLGVCIGVIVVLAGLLISKFFKKDLYGSYFENYAMVELSRSSDQSHNTSSGFILYSQENYAEAISALVGKSDNSSLFYLAISHMQIGNHEKALDVLIELESRNNLQYPINYYKGLCLLKLQRNEEARLSFLAVGSRFDYYHKKALRVLREL